MNFECLISSLFDFIYTMHFTSLDILSGLMLLNISSFVTSEMFPKCLLPSLPTPKRCCKYFSDEKYLFIMYEETRHLHLNNSLDKLCRFLPLFSWYILFFLILPFSATRNYTCLATILFCEVFLSSFTIFRLQLLFFGCAHPIIFPVVFVFLYQKYCSFV